MADFLGLLEKIIIFRIRILIITYQSYCCSTARVLNHGKMKRCMFYIANSMQTTDTCETVNYLKKWFELNLMDLRKKNTILLIVLALAAATMFFGIMIKMVSG